LLIINRKVVFVENTIQSEKIKKALPEVELKQFKENLVFKYPVDIFTNNTLEKDISDLIKQIINKYGTMSNSDIKTKVYLTDPMRAFLRIEQHNGLNLYNVPIQFNSL
jgi:uncharacterized phage-associated protein